MESTAAPPPVMESTAAPPSVMESYPPSFTSDHAISPPSMEFAASSLPSSTSDGVIPPSSVETTATSSSSSTSDRSVPRCNVQHLLPLLRRVADGAGDGGHTEVPVIFKDIRRYYCEYCGICRSKKSLIRSHILTHHKEKLPDAQANESKAEKSTEPTERMSYTCQECGAKFKKPAYLQQHMQSHSLEDLYIA